MSMHLCSSMHPLDDPFQPVYKPNSPNQDAVASLVYRIRNPLGASIKAVPV